MFGWDSIYPSPRPTNFLTQIFVSSLTCRLATSSFERWHTLSLKPSKDILILFIRPPRKYLLLLSYVRPYSESLYSFVNPVRSQAAISSKPISNVMASESNTSNVIPASCNSTITPACLQALYGIPTTIATQSSNILGVSSFSESADKADLRV